MVAAFLLLVACSSLDTGNPYCDAYVEVETTCNIEEFPQYGSVETCEDSIDNESLDSGDIADFETCGACLQSEQGHDCESIYSMCACDCGRITGYSEC